MMALVTMIIIIYMNWLQSCLLIIVGRELRISEEKRVSKFHKKQQVLFILTVSITCEYAITVKEPLLF